MLGALRNAGSSIGTQGVRRILQRFVGQAVRVAKSDEVKKAGTDLAKEGYSRAVQAGAKALEEAQSGGTGIDPRAVLGSGAGAAVASSAQGSVEGALSAMGFSSQGAQSLMSFSMPESSADQARLFGFLVLAGIVTTATITALRRYASGESKNDQNPTPGTGSLEDVD